MKNGQPESEPRELLLAVSLKMFRSVTAFFAGNPEPLKSSTHETGKRAEDRNEDMEKGTDIEKRANWGTFLVAIAFAASFCGGGGFIYVYWYGGNNLLLGGTLAIFLGGLGIALVLYARWLTIHKQATEARELLTSPPDEREAATATFIAGLEDVRRRGILKWMIAMAVAVVAAGVVTLLRSLGSPPAPALFTRVWRRGQRLYTVEGRPISADALQPGEFVIVFPEESLGDDTALEKSQTVLLRVKEDLLELPDGRKDWAPMGYLAYSRVCTHAGCAVGLFETTTDLLMCPCHQSTFNILKGAVPNGGPAVRPLPQLPLYVESDGTLRAGGGFTAPPGPGFWGMPCQDC